MRRSGRGRGGRQPEPPAPFLLALESRGNRRRREPRRQQAMARLAAAWDALAPLEEAAWRGRLSPRGLADLQRARVAYARLFAEVRP